MGNGQSQKRLGMQLGLDRLYTKFGPINIFMHCNIIKARPKNDRDMSAIRRVVEDPSCFESFIERCSARLGISIPEHPAMDWMYVLLKLKPPDSSLKVFWMYMVCVSRCCTSDYYDFSEFDSSIDVALMHENEIYFFLNELDSDDLQFLFTKIIGVFPIKEIPDEKTGNSLYFGELAPYFDPNDYKKIISFVDAAQISFSKHLEQISHITKFPFIDTQLVSLFNMSSKPLLKSLPGMAYPPIDPPV
jgi:hypothetical protein